MQVVVVEGSHNNGARCPHVERSPIPKINLRDTVRQEPNHSTTWRSSAKAIRTVNQIVRGWGAHFLHSTAVAADLGA